jgi:hypothetical protein
MKYLSGFAKTNIRTAINNTIPQNIIEPIIPISNEESMIIPMAIHENRNEPANVVANIFLANLATTYELIRFTRIAKILKIIIIVPKR